MSYPFISVEEADWFALIDGDTDDEGQSESQIDVKHIRSDGV